MDLQKRLDDLRAKVVACDEKIKEVENKAKADKRELSDFELATTIKATTEIEKLKGRIDEVLDQTKAENLRLLEGDSSSRESVEDGLPGSFTPIAGKSEGIPGHAAWREIMGRAPTQDTDFRSMRDFQRAVEAKDPRLFSRRDVRGAATESVPAGGGFLIGENFEATILDNALPAEIIRPRCRVFGITQGEKLRIPAWDNGNRSACVYGGMTWQWVPEGGTITPTDPKFKRLELTANKMIVDGKTSSELGEDVLATYRTNPLADMLAKVVGYAFDNEFLNGDGHGRPLGILNAPALIVVDEEDGQEEDTVEYANLVKMFARSLNPLGSVWICNPTCIPTLLQMVQTAGTGGFPVPVMSQASGQFSILTRPTYFSEHLPTVGNHGDIVLADLSMYGVLIRAGMTLLTSTAAYWTTDEVGIRMRVRVDGQPLIDAAVQPRLGDTLSPFIALAERA